MKNIHIIETENPSKLFYNVGGQLLFRSYLNHNGVNLYITSDEDVETGYWCLCEDKIVFKAFYKADGYITAMGKKGLSFSEDNCKKIVLTTDPQLISDGVQSIDQKFLEWFVNNSNCEFVDIEREILKLVYNPNYIDHTPSGDGIYSTPRSENLQYGEIIINDNFIVYEIMTPKEEPLQHIEYTNTNDCTSMVYNPCTCVRPDDNTCEYCDEKQNEAILKECSIIAINENLKRDAHKYLVDKGCLSVGQKYTALEVENMLVEFALQQKQ